MASKQKHPSTQAIRTLQQSGTRYTLHLYRYQERGGTEVAARELNVEEHRVIKTLVFEDEKGNPLFLLMHGDKTVSEKNLARTLGVKTIRPCSPETAQRHTGYRVGGISPFGTKKSIPVYIEETILDLERIFINAGRRGLLAEVETDMLRPILNPGLVRVGI